MKIMQVIPSLDLAGAEVMCQNLSMELMNLGHKVVVVSLYKKETIISKRLEALGVRVIFLNKKAGFDILCIMSLIKVIKKFKPEVVHSHIYACKYAHIASCLCGVRSKIHTVHSIASKEVTIKGDMLFSRLMYKLGIITPVALSYEVKKSLISFYNLRKVSIPVVYNGVPLEKCCPIDDYPDNIRTFIHVGRFMKPKNHKGLINAFVDAHRYNENIELLLYGNGELFDEMKKIVIKKGASDYIHFMGTTDDVYGAMNNADVFIMPSLYEGMPITIIEAMGTGLPIIASAVGGIVDMLHNDEEALLIDGDEKSISEAIIKITKDAELRKKIGINAKIRANDFSAKKMAINYLNIYCRGLR